MRHQDIKEIQEPLMLVMPVKPGQLPALREALKRLAEPAPRKALEDALDKVGTVHSTRFVVLEDEDGAWAKLIVIAQYDGSVEDYIKAFARELKTQFNLLFTFIEDTDDKPGPKVEEDVERFIQYVRNRDVRPANEQSYHAYPGLTALDIIEVTRPPNDGAPTL
jgi:hypothetical protein